MSFLIINKTKEKKITNASFIDYSDSFKNLVTKKNTKYISKVASLYTDKFLYFNFYLKNINKKHTKLELFIGGKKIYYELQFSPYNFKNEVLFIEQKSYTKNSVFNTKTFSLINNKPDVLGGFQDKLRYYKSNPYWAFKNYKIKNLIINSKINKNKNTCNILIKLPINSLNFIFSNNKKLKINFFRFEKNKTILAYKAYGIYDCHFLEQFPNLKLSI